MPAVHRSKLEAFKHELIVKLTPLPQSALVNIERDAVPRLEKTGNIIVEKVRRHGKPEMLLEFSCHWVGVDRSPDAMLAELEEAWPPPILGSAHEKHLYFAQDETAQALFVAEIEGKNFLTGWIHIVP